MLHDDGKFEWDEDKAALNAAKHGVTFEEACEVFDDPHEVEFFDRDHSDDEARFARIGFRASDYCWSSLLCVQIGFVSFMLEKRAKR
jgi:uncharacterized DUF497 family protein